MKRILQVFFILLNSTAYSQYDTLNIEFIEDHDTFPDCKNIYAVNGQYILPSIEVNNLKLPGFVFINPRIFQHDDKLTLYSDQGLAERMGHFEVPRYHYEPIAYNEFMEVRRRCDSIYTATYQSCSDPKNVIYLAPDPTKKQFRAVYLDSLREAERIEDSIERSNSIQRGVELDAGPVNVPAVGIIDGVFIPDSYIFKTDLFVAHPEILDSVRHAHDSIRTQRVQPLIDSILQPFYLSKTEVTNREYRDFIDYVRDSIAIHKLYECVDDDELAANLLNVSRKQRRKLNTAAREENLSEYGLATKKKNGKPSFYYDDPNNIPCLADMYYPQPQRYYKRREIDVRKLIYRLNDSTSVAIYPDTTALQRIQGNERSTLSSMYFWHPYYEQYPVLCLTDAQIMAYCNWKERQLNKAVHLDSHYIHVNLPSITQYEFAAKRSYTDIQGDIHDQKNNDFNVYYRNDENFNYSYFIKRVTTYPSEVKKMGFGHYMIWYNSNYNSLFFFLNGNASEMVRDKVTREKLDCYGIQTDLDPDSLRFSLGGNYYMGVKTNSDIQPNATFYKRAIPKNKPDPMTGFRLVYTIERNTLND